MKLTYWKISQPHDSNCFSIRAKTKKAALKELKDVWNPEHYAKEINKIEIEYIDAYDLMKELTYENTADEFIVKTYPIK